MSEQKNSAGSRRPVFVLVAIVAVVGATALYGRLSGRASGGEHDLQDGCGGAVPADQAGGVVPGPGSEARSLAEAPPAKPGGEAEAEKEKPETVVRVPQDVATIQAADRPVSCLEVTVEK